MDLGWFLLPFLKTVLVVRGHRLVLIAILFVRGLITLILLGLILGMLGLILGLLSLVLGLLRVILDLFGLLGHIVISLLGKLLISVLITLVVLISLLRLVLISLLGNVLISLEILLRHVGELLVSVEHRLIATLRHLDRFLVENVAANLISLLVHHTLLVSVLVLVGVEFRV